ncbi:DUF6311 domain-containing protein [Pseudomonas luteola]|uniref:DUF6311 domain-containing protein n=1 Tax=Pseudomonas luteola TaxID=47886 RepID=UPI001EF514E1|nr:DUF6311 domain-containing protein [Pseudomonas luteola]MCG7375262.1 DUF6311 domain-containing protein [Pseudomonas luteola]
MINISPVVLGVLAFLFVVGPRVLLPTNIAWLANGDPSQHFLGWQFFRNSPWQIPVGLNYNFGLDLKNSIVFTDSNPILAFIFKPLSPFLPKVFQYFGFWLLICFILQSWFGWKLATLISKNKLICLLSSGIFLFSPIFLNRLTVHLSLSGHFLVLAALYLSLRSNQGKRTCFWALTLSITALTHAYLLLMVLIIWASDLVNRLIKKNNSLSKSIIEFFIVLLITLILCWQAGYFSVSGGSVANGYGIYRMNILSPFDPDNWSYVLQDIPGTQDRLESFNFIGTGVIILLLIGTISISGIKVFSIFYYNLPLLFSVIGLFFFSLSNNIGFGPYNFTYPIHDSIYEIANIFRASARFFWPAYYLIFLTAIYLTVKFNGSKKATILLSVALIIQIADMSKTIISIHRTMMITPNSKWESPLKDSFWDYAGKKYTKLRVIPLYNNFPNWNVLADYASSYGMATDAVYLARIDVKKVDLINSRNAQMINSGDYSKDSLYIVSPDHVDQVKSHLKTVDKLIKVDGFNVIAPNCEICETQ